MSRNIPRPLTEIEIYEWVRRLGIAVSHHFTPAERQRYEEKLKFSKHREAIGAYSALQRPAMGGMRGAIVPDRRDPNSTVAFFPKRKP